MTSVALCREALELLPKRSPIALFDGPGNRRQRVVHEHSCRAFASRATLKARLHRLLDVLDLVSRKVPVLILAGPEQFGVAETHFNHRLAEAAKLISYGLEFLLGVTG